MNKCGHQDCFTCPFPDCKETSNGIQSLSQGREFDGLKHSSQPKQGRAIVHTAKGFKGFR